MSNELISSVNLELLDPAEMLQHIQNQKNGAKKERKNPYVAPQTDTEKQIVMVWKELLQVEQIGTLDSFFELGGDSLMAIRALSRLRDLFNVELPLNIILTDNFTVAECAQAIETYQIQTADWDDVVAVLSELEQLSPEELAQLLAEG